MVDWVLIGLGKAAVKVAAYCVKEVADNPNEKTGQEAEPEAGEDKAEQEMVTYSSGNEYVKMYPIMNLPTDTLAKLYLSPYYTMPSKFKVYKVLCDLYRHELLQTAKGLLGCNDFQAEVMVKSMDYYLSEYRAGNGEPFSGHRGCIDTYSNLSQVVSSQDTDTLAYRVTMAERFINQLGENDNPLKESGELLTSMKDTGQLPKSSPLVLLDLMAFITIPKYFRLRVHAINMNFNSTIEVCGEFNVN
jgi:hypothetical protein